MSTPIVYMKYPSLKRTIWFRLFCYPRFSLSKNSSHLWHCGNNAILAPRRCSLQRRVQNVPDDQGMGVLWTNRPSKQKGQIAAGGISRCTNMICAPKMQLENQVFNIINLRLLNCHTQSVNHSIHRSLNYWTSLATRKMETELNKRLAHFGITRAAWTVLGGINFDKKLPHLSWPSFEYHPGGYCKIIGQVGNTETDNLSTDGWRSAFCIPSVDAQRWSAFCGDDVWNRVR